MVNLFSNRRIQFGALALFILTYCYWVFHGVFVPGYSLTNSGDGIGTISMFAHLMNSFQETRFAIFLNDFVQFSSFAAGYDNPIPFNLIWKIIYLTFGGVFSPDNAYDSIEAVAFAATILSGYVVSRFFGSSVAVSIIIGVLLANLPNFYVRIAGHIGLACYFVSIAQIGFAHRLAKRFDYTSSVLFGLFSAFTFVQNEYYGYFGIIFCSVYILTTRLLVFSNNFRADLYPACKLAAVSFFVFVLSMAMLYPGQIGAKLFPFFENAGQGSAAITATHNYSVSEFNTYATPHPLGLFTIGIPSLTSLTTHLNDGNPGEFSFRIGLVIPVVILTLLIWAKRTLPNARKKIVHRQIIALAISCVVMVMFALPLSSFWSLAGITLKVASIFRVGSRAYIYVDIAMLLMLSILVSEYLLTLYCVRNSIKKQSSISLIIILVLYLAYVDLTCSWGIKQVNALRLPLVSEELRILENKGQGALVELPFFTSSASPESSYIYAYDYAIHHKPVINGIHFLLPQKDPELDRLMNNAAAKINAPTVEVIENLGKAGVRYLVVNKGTSGVQFDPTRLSQLSLIAESANLGIYEIKSYDYNGNFMGDFVVGKPNRVKWGNCGDVYELNGHPRRFCQFPFSIEVQNYAKATLSGRFSCKITPTKSTSIQVNSTFAPPQLLTNDGLIDHSVNVSSRGTLMINILAPHEKHVGASISVEDCGIHPEGKI